jgi:hypothetical protein
MNTITASHDGLPDTVAPERLLAKKIKAGTATPFEALEWLRITGAARANQIAVQACDIIEDHCFVIRPTHIDQELTMNTAEDVTLKLGKINITMPANDFLAVMMQEITQHDDDKAVNKFAAAMRAKMKHAREVKGLSGWNDPAQCDIGYLNSRLCEQINKGDPVDLANFAMMLYARGERITVSRSLIAHSAIPRLGEFWQGQGGFYAGTVRGMDGKNDHHLIVSPDDLGEIKEAEWGCKGNEIKGADSDWDGLSNTRAMADAGSELAKTIIAMEIDGHKDWYLPARKEARLCQINCQNQFDHDSWYWTSTQYSAYLAFIQDFGDGHQHDGLKGSSYRARAVRRLSVI